MPLLTLTGTPTFNGDSSCTIDATGADRVQAPVGTLDETQGWVAARIKMGFASTATQTPPNYVAWIFDWEDSFNDQIAFGWQNNGLGGQGWWSGRVSGGSGLRGVWKTSTFSAGDHKTLIMRWNATTWNQSIDGAAWGGDASPATVIPTLAATLFDIGSSPPSSAYGCGDIYWYAWGTGTLSDADAATINGFGDTDHLPADFPGACVAVWPATSATFNDTTAPAPPGFLPMFARIQYT